MRVCDRCGHLKGSGGRVLTKRRGETLDLCAGCADALDKFLANETVGAAPGPTAHPLETTHT
jgi:hypothetical protein